MKVFLCLTLLLNLNEANSLENGTEDGRESRSVHRVPQVPGSSRDRDLGRQTDKHIYNNPIRRYYSNDREDYNYYDSGHHDDSGDYRDTMRPDRYHDNRDSNYNDNDMSRPCTELIDNLKSELIRDDATLMLQSRQGDAKVDISTKLLPLSH